jgi:succinoglycan biosynthesis protein ExoA
MSQPLPTVSVIIAARPGQEQVKAVDAARKLDYPAEKLELIVARGTQPAIQRNVAIREAKGEWIYFLDDDSVPPRDNLMRAAPYLLRPGVEMVGGPNVCPEEAPTLEQAFALVMSSWLAFGPSRARYIGVGGIRETGEKELILCNLIARRSTLVELNGFDESLYPNEENALMDTLRARGGKMLYDPAFLVYRRPRKSLKSFIKMLVTYGRGRAEQFRRHPTLGSAPNFVPPLFCVYLPLAVILRGHWLWPLAAYALAVAAQAMSLPSGTFLTRLYVMPLILLTHGCYGAGFWRGLVGKYRSARAPGTAPVTIEKLAVP